MHKGSGAGQDQVNIEFTTGSVLVSSYLKNIIPDAQA
jgi:hypothetical protein